MSKIDETIAHLDRAMKLTDDLQKIVERSVRRQRIVGILIGIVLVGAIYVIARIAA